MGQKRKLSQSQYDHIMDMVNSGKMTPNQARKSCGLKPLDGGDVYIISDKFSSHNKRKPVAGS